MRQTALWTALPAGRTTSGGLRLSVLVSPQLFPDEGQAVTLSCFPDFVAWSSIPVGFRVRFGSGETRPASIISPPTRPELWQALFPAETPVLPFAVPRLQDRRIHTYPVAPVKAYIQGQYEVLAAAHPTQPPGLEVYFGMAHAIGGARTAEGGATDQRDTPRWAYAQARALVTDLRREREEAAPQPLDFHQLIASVGPYPEIMRLLGLVYDVEISAEGVAPEGMICVEPDWRPQTASTQNLTPYTQYQWDGRYFMAAPSPAAPEFDRGFLRLGDPAYGVVRVDLDSAVVELTDFADAVVRQRREKAGQRESLMLPALHSYGLTIYRSGRYDAVQRSLAKATEKGEALRAGNPAVLHAADVVQGYRIDVWDSRSGHWHSLCRRVGRYHFPGAQVVTQEDEGIVPAGGILAPDGRNGDLYVHEALFHWNGYSMVAPRLESRRSPAAAATDRPESGRLEVSFVPAPRSLPRLRHGVVYRIRARAVDLAGNSLSLEDEPEGFAHATGPITYGRFDPVGSPTIGLSGEPEPGGALETLVIRSDVNRLAVTGAERSVSQPLIPGRIAEAHGKADPGVLGDTPDPMARGVAFRGLPGLPADEVLRLSFGDLPWPDALPFWLRLEEGSGRPFWDEEQRRLTVYLEKGQTAKVKLSSYLAVEDLPELGLWQWLEQGDLPAARLVYLKELVAGGLHWMFTPYREITLVHAVRQPLAAPAWQSPAVTRSPGQTQVTLLDRVAVHGRSTGRLTVEAAWDELGTKSGQVTPFHARVADVPVGPNDAYVLVKSRHDFGDTRYRKVRFTLVAHSRFASYFAETPAADVTRASEQSVEHEVLCSARPPAPVVLWAEPVGGPAETGWRIYLDNWFASGAGEQLGLLQTEGVLGHAVRFDHARGLWYAEVPQSRATDRIELARYQPKALLGLTLSPATPLSVTRLPGGYALTVVRGAVPEEANLVVSGQPAANRAQPDWVVRVERKTGAVWEPFGPTPAALAPAEGDFWPPEAWCASVPLPVGGQPYRLVVEARRGTTERTLAEVMAVVER